MLTGVEMLVLYHLCKIMDCGLIIEIIIIEIF